MQAQARNTVYGGGFANPPVDSAHGFRAAMNAMARPGTIQHINGATPPDGISPAAGCLLLTLCDPETGVYLGSDVDSEALRGWLTLDTGALSGYHHGTVETCAERRRCGHPLPAGRTAAPRR